jgi:hypothetical protein
MDRHTSGVSVIVQHIHSGTLVDRQALAYETGLSETTIRMRLRASTYDGATGRALYDYETARAALSDVRPWPAMQGKKRRASA